MTPRTQPLLTTFLAHQRAIVPCNSDGDYFGDIVDERAMAHSSFTEPTLGAIAKISGLAGASLDEA